jgi:hypothetical protein
MTTNVWLKQVNFSARTGSVDAGTAIVFYLEKLPSKKIL